MRKWREMGLIMAMCAALAMTACVSEPAQTATTGVRQTEAGEASRGLVYAEQNCASCHAIQASETMSPNMDATDFVTIANTPGMTSIALSAWMQSAHPTMPQLLVGQDQVDDLWAYMLTLREPD
jgi:mono/diheme cytochrome c family protein